MGLLAYI
jgi:hypothetical protein